jgi:hypothetical protein
VLLLQALEAETRLDLRLLVQRSEYALDVRDVLSSLFQMFFESVAELVVLNLI